ncbi:hypothetical protein M8J76_008864 [Diaphorina citri]|nr:hypothetical protein M8J76_008864 [Diaphorina citri]
MDGRGCEVKLSGGFGRRKVWDARGCCECDLRLTPIHAHYFLSVLRIAYAAPVPRRHVDFGIDSVYRDPSPVSSNSTVLLNRSCFHD